MTNSVSQSVTPMISKGNQCYVVPTRFVLLYLYSLSSKLSLHEGQGKVGDSIFCGFLIFLESKVILMSIFFQYK